MISTTHPGSPDPMMAIFSLPFADIFSPFLFRFEATSETNLSKHGWRSVHQAPRLHLTRKDENRLYADSGKDSPPGSTPGSFKSPCVIFCMNATISFPADIGTAGVSVLHKRALCPPRPCLIPLHTLKKWRSWHSEHFENKRIGHLVSPINYLI